MKFVSVIKNRLFNPFGELCRSIKRHNIRLGLAVFCASCFNQTALSKFLDNRKHKEVLRILNRDYKNVLIRNNNRTKNTQYDKNAPVWVCWFQGFENAPVLVKKCVKSIKKSTPHPVNLISLCNLDEYIALPDYILDKYSKGIITNAHFSDIVRMTLLSEYGGIWIDATIFIPDKIPEEIFKRKFYSCKRNINSSNYVSNCRWTAFLFASHKGCVIPTTAKELFFEYWKENNYLIDYLLVDYFVELIYENMPYATDLIDNLPYNNSMIDELQNRFNDEFNKDEYETLITTEDTNFFKLSWRMDFVDKKQNGKQTYFGYFLNN